MDSFKKFVISIIDELNIKSRHSKESRAFLVSLASGCFAFITSLIVLLWTGPVKILENNDISLGTLTLAISGISSLIIFSTVIFKNETKDLHKPRFRKYLTSASNSTIIAFIYTAIGFLLTIMAFYLFKESFKGMELSPIVASLIVTTIVAIEGYFIYLIATSITTLALSGALATFMLIGIFTSMLTAENPIWWQMHFSYLGEGSGFSSYAFNLTLIIAGMVIISLASFMKRDFIKLGQINPEHSITKIPVLYISLTVIGVLLACVGLFPFDKFSLVHRIAAYGMVLIFVGITLCIPYLTPTLSKTFFAFSYLITGMLLILFVLTIPLEYISLTVYEFIAFMSVFLWLIIFVRQIALQAKKQ